MAHHSVWRFALEVSTASTFLDGHAGAILGDADPGHGLLSTHQGRGAYAWQLHCPPLPPLPALDASEFQPPGTLFPIAALTARMHAALAPVATFWVAAGMSVSTHWPQHMNEFLKQDTFGPLADEAGAIMQLLAWCNGVADVPDTAARRMARQLHMDAARAAAAAAAAAATAAEEAAAAEQAAQTDAQAEVAAPDPAMPGAPTASGTDIADGMAQVSAEPVAQLAGNEQAAQGAQYSDTQPAGANGEAAEDASAEEPAIMVCPAVLLMRGEMNGRELQCRHAWQGQSGRIAVVFEPSCCEPADKRTQRSTPCCMRCVLSLQASPVSSSCC